MALAGGCTLMAATAAAHYVYWTGPTVPDRVRVHQVRSLSFGTIAPDTQASGRVRVSASRDGASYCGRPLHCFSRGTRGRFRLSSTRTRYVYVHLPHQAVLTNNQGDRMHMHSFTMSGRNFFRRIGVLYRDVPTSIGIGATLSVRAQQPPGHYRGSYEIAVNYE